MARRTGLEPATPGVTGRYSNQLSYHRAQKKWWVMTESNRRHSACKADALPTELITHVFVHSTRRCELNQTLHIIASIILQKTYDKISTRCYESEKTFITFSPKPSEISQYAGLRYNKQLTLLFIMAL